MLDPIKTNRNNLNNKFVILKKIVQVMTQEMVIRYFLKVVLPNIN